VNFLEAVRRKLQPQHVEATMRRARARDLGPVLVKPLVLFVIPALTVTALWLPFGFSLGGLIEEWDVLALFARHGLFFIADGSSPLAAHSARPLTILPHAIAFWLDGDSFLYWHLTLMLALCAKSVCGAFIGLKLTGRLGFAMLLALLLLLYPADTMQLNFRALHINVALALALIGCVINLHAYEATAGRISQSLAVLAPIAFLVAALMYEGSVGLFVFPFAILFAKYGNETGRVVARKPVVLALWCVGLLGWAAFFLTALGLRPTYQTEVLSGSYGLWRLGDIARSGLYRAFFEGWHDTMRIAYRELEWPVYPALAMIIVPLVLALLMWRDQGQEQLSSLPATRAQSWLAARTAVAGLLAFTIGYGPFLASTATTAITQRTFLAATPGAALVVLAALLWIDARTSKWITVAASSLLFGLCFVAQLYQFDKYNRVYASVIQPILHAVIQLVGGPNDHPIAVLFNNYGYLNGVWDFGSGLVSALYYVAPHSGFNGIFVCESTSGRTLPRQRVNIDRRSRCESENEKVLLKEYAHPAVELTGAKVAVLNIDGTLTVRGPQSETEIPIRARRLLKQSTWGPEYSIFRSQKSEQFVCQFESMWGYAYPCRTFGFFEGESFSSILGPPFAWIAEPRAGFIFDISPGHDRYRLTLNVHHVILSPDRNIRVFLNEQEIGVSLGSPGRIEGVVNGELLTGRHNVLELRTAPDDSFGVSFGLTSVVIRPER
jgi:hypothetical protein